MKNESELTIVVDSEIPADADMIQIDNELILLNPIHRPSGDGTYQECGGSVKVLSNETT